MIAIVRAVIALGIAGVATALALAAVVWMSTEPTATERPATRTQVVYEIAQTPAPEPDTAIEQPVVPTPVAVATQRAAGPAPMPKQSALVGGPAGSITPSAIGGLPIVGTDLGTTAGAIEIGVTPQPGEPDVAAKPLVRPSPRYPRAAQRSGVEGHVIVRMRIDERGRVVDVAVVEGTPAGVFDDVALQTARTYRFSPARRGGKAVATTVQQRIVFRLGR